MPKFTPGVEVTSTPPNSPSIEVTIDPAAPLAAGDYKFRLVVEDDQGLVSEPAIVSVKVQDTRPIASLEGTPEVVDFGKSFKLVGENSRATVAGRRIRKYTWTLLR